MIIVKNIMYNLIDTPYTKPVRNTRKHFVKFLQSPHFAILGVTDKRIYVG